ncbi:MULTISPECIES: helix-turn-helix transcriptional regulator [unclassified Leptolyngbya]|uniref:helix-turn-helix transcriptional regulator n=1 Tax=unclassified Leptolyngbya TaxID=2650499 RepID=UPI0016822847|nr:MULTISPECIES: helix-turn-helix transcriptional regulator [unclassified Leptolyngbya]MBD1910782.1 helix-turn-helix transcriptional regulator [Leptolyngbya sp. FACHB-8]MBD2158858.1 helix-turn-helix transcriptional regulator [Leptolyngbya sp. FACHB-16]
MSENFFLQAIVESYPDGILIVNNHGLVVAVNQSARQICKHLDSDGLPESQVPPSIWRICRSLFENRDEFGDLPIIIEDRIDLLPVGYVRVRAQWFIPDATNPCIIVTLEDTLQNARSLVNAEKRKYGLTEREMEVQLLRQVQCTYESIAQQLHITVNTVKKHVKSINMKRSASLYSSDHTV